MKKLSSSNAVILCLVAILAGVTVSELSGHTSKSKTRRKTPVNTPSPAALKQLELQVTNAEEQFVRTTVEAAKELEKGGLLSDAKKLLQKVAKVRADLPGLKDKIDELEESILSNNPFEFAVDTSRGWGDPVAAVQGGKPFRIQSKGSYRFNVQLVSGPTGFPTADPLHDMAKDIPAGALMGLIVAVDDKGKAKKPGQPFVVGDNKEVTPKENGLLFLTVNAPSGHKCTGEIDIQLSGYANPL